MHYLIPLRFIADLIQLHTMKERLAFGVDFGTSNSAIGAVENDNLRIYETRENTTSQPSSIFIRADGYHSVGFDALDDFLDPDKKTDAYHFIPSVKPGLPLERYEGNVLVSDEQNLSGRNIRKFYPVEELASFVIKDLKRKAEDQSGEKVNKAVVGRPVIFSEQQVEDNLAQQRLETAARLAGFTEVSFVLEPVAAALYYEKNFAKPGDSKVLVFDFGGGTLDTCILEIGQQNSNDLLLEKLNSRVLSSHGVNLGGTDLDKDVFRKYLLDYFGSNITWGEKNLPMPSHVHSDITEWHLLQYMDQRSLFEFLNHVASDRHATDKDAIKRLITLISDQQVFGVLQNIESAKIQLSESNMASVNHHFGNIDIEMPITRKQFETAVSFRKREIRECVNETLDSAQLKAKDIDVVIRVGGSSNNPFTESLLLENFDRVEKTEAFTSVVAGLSLVANEIFK